MSDHTESIRQIFHRLQSVAPFLPFDNLTFGNPTFEAASTRVLIARLSPFRDVDRSIPHLFLFQEVRRALPDAFIDLAFFPPAADRELFEQESIPLLIGTQSLRSADEFDLVLISNAYTLEVINLPYLLLRSRFPAFSSQRGPEWPIILLGGSNALATQGVIREDGDSLVDGIFFGEGERLAGELAGILAQHGEEDKQRLLAQAAREVTGFWAAGSRRSTAKAVCDPDAGLLPAEYPILNTPEADTANLQITYGCPAFCSFCLEGYDRKPYRELPLAEILATARRIKQAQGVEELSLYSFNFNTHGDILDMILELHRLFERVSFKSQRLDILQHTPTLLEAEVAADKREFTLGIEGISARQRAFLHKSLSTGHIESLLDRLLAQKIRRIKLFYVLTGHETEEDVAEFREFVRWLKGTRRSRNRRVRVIFSFGLLVRMPFTPLRYDRLFLDEAEWKRVIGQAKSACETNGFEFRLAFDWPAYCVTQVLALGGYWLVEPLVALAEKGYSFDATLPAAYWDELRSWMQRAGYWSDEFLGEKGPDYPFPLEFVASNVPPEFLYRQFREAQAGTDSGYCLGDRSRPGRCLGCGACVDKDQQRAITHHQVHRPEAAPYLAQLRDLMARKRKLQSIHFLLRVEPWLAGVEPELLNALVFQEILARYPDLVDDLLAVRESLFTVRPNDRRFPAVYGETVFALKAWDVEALQHTLTDAREHTGKGFEIVGPVEGFTPGEFTKLHLDVHLPADFFPEPRARLEEVLRSAYLPYSLRREGDGYRFDLTKKALKKRILFEGYIEEREGGFRASLDAGPKFDLGAFLRAFGAEGLARHAQVRVSGIEW